MRSAQQQAVQLVQSFTGTSQAHARTVLAMPSVYWDVERACNHILEAGMEVELSSDDDTERQHDDEDLVAWFSKYKEPTAESIQTTGLLEFCEDIGVDPEDLVVLVLVWKMQAKSSTQITKEEFLHGMHALQVSSIAALKQQLPALKKELSKPKSFKAVYEFTYGWALEPGMKGLPKDVALAYWTMLLPLAKFDLMNEFLAFMQARSGGVSKDLWFQVLLFISQVNGDFSRYDENGAWSFVLDEFVAERKKSKAA